VPELDLDFLQAVQVVCLEAATSSPITPFLVLLRRVA
jgi:hypothetical protein